MKRRQLALRLFAILAICTGAWLAISGLPVSAAESGPIVVIVNVANPIQNLSMTELKELFLSDRSHWETGRSVAPVMLVAGSAERTAFLKIVCGMNDGDFGKYFLRAAFTGKSAMPPKEFSNSAALKSFVASYPGAIGFVNATKELPKYTNKGGMLYVFTLP